MRCSNESTMRLKKNMRIVSTSFRNSRRHAHMYWSYLERPWTRRRWRIRHEGQEEDEEDEEEDKKKAVKDKTKAMKDNKNWPYRNTLVVQFHYLFAFALGGYTSLECCWGYAETHIVVQCSETWRVVPRVRTIVFALTACRALIWNENNTNVIHMHICMYVHGVSLELPNWFDPRWHGYHWHFCVGWVHSRQPVPGRVGQATSRDVCMVCMCVCMYMRYVCMYVCMYVCTWFVVVYDWSQKFFICR